MAPGRYAVGTPSPLVVVETGVLHDAIERLAGLRHARPGAQPVPLKAEEVDALEALDNHPALATLADETLEELWIAAHASDALESERAPRLLGCPVLRRTERPFEVNPVDEQRRPRRAASTDLPGLRPRSVEG